MRAFALFLVLCNTKLSLSMKFSNNLRGSQILQSIANATRYMLPSSMRADIVQVGLDLIPNLGCDVLKFY